MAVTRVPALSNRGVPPPNENVPGPSTANCDPASFVITPPFMIKLPPIHDIVPAFSRVRPLNVGVVTLMMLNEAPGSTTVVPVPPMVPPSQVPVPAMVSLPATSNSGPLSLPPNVKSRKSAFPFKVTVTTWTTITTLSFEPGTRLGNQFDATFQSPEKVLVQVMERGWKCAKSVRLVFMVTVMALLRVTTSPVQA